MGRQRGIHALLTVLPLTLVQKFVREAVEKASDTDLEDGDLVTDYDRYVGDLDTVEITKGMIAEDSGPLGAAARVVSKHVPLLSTTTTSIIWCVLLYGSKTWVGTILPK